MLRLTNSGEVFTETAHRLIRWGMSEREAFALAQVMTLTGDASDDAVQNAVCLALVSAKQAVDGVAEIEYITGRRCDVQRRLEGRE